MNTKLFSRQIGALGKDSMHKLMELNILLIGENGITLECIKCLSLLGVNQINLMIYDNNLNTKNLKNKFFMDIETNKVSSLFINLVKSLNPNVKVSLVNNYKNQPYDAIILTSNKNKINIFELEKYCFSQKTKLIIGLNHELLGYVHSNFINQTVLDKDGELLENSFVNSFNYNNDNIILKLDKMHKNLNSNLGKLNYGDQEIIINIFKSNLEQIVMKKNLDLINFLEKCDLNINNLRFTEVKERLEFVSKDLNQKISELKYNLIDTNSSFKKNDQLYQNYTNYLFRNQKWEVDFELDKKFYLIEVIIGSILSHEVIKITGKYTPLENDLLFDFSKLRGKKFYRSRDSDIKSILDKSILKEMQKLNIFMVGCGALGCEISKNLAMLDFCSSKKSLLTVTDMDTIELSNLNRQFLFRNENINDFKSKVLKDRIIKYKPNMNVDSLKLEVSDKNLDTFSNKFFQNNDIIINALDNIEARKYVDSRCVFNEKPLFESGTLGSKCNTQIIIPHKTATYSEIIDYEEKSIPMCTVKNFPYKIEHCVEWSLQLFEEIFTSGFQDLKNFNSNTNFLEEIEEQNNELIKFNRLRTLYILSLLQKKQDFKTFMIFANLIYDIYFKTPVQNILKSFPENLQDCNGKKFWTGNKLIPKIITFDKIPKSFLKNLYQFVNLSIPLKQWEEEYLNQLGEIDIEKEFNYLIIEQKLKYDSNKNEMSKNTDSTDYSELSFKIIELIKKEHNLSTKNINNQFQKIRPFEYDKDDDTHLKIMHSFSNLRAEIYSIIKIELIDTQLISGKIIPALSTTTSLVAGFIVLEIIKYLMEMKSSDLNVNLGINSYTLFDSQKPKKKYNNMFSKVFNCKIKTIPENFNTWSRIKIDGNSNNIQTIEDVILYLDLEHEIKPDMLNVGKKIIYQNVRNKKKYSEKKIMDIFKELDIPLWEHLRIEISSFTIEGLPILSPPIIFKF